MTATGLRRVGHWRNHRWGWGMRHLWLFTDGLRWWVYARQGTADSPRKTWKGDFPDEASARAFIDTTIARCCERDGDTWSAFE